MHPCNNACALCIFICLMKCLTNQFICDQNRFPHDFIWKNARLIQYFYHLFRMIFHMPQTLVSIQILGTRTKPKFIIFYCLHKNLLILFPQLSLLPMAQYVAYPVLLFRSCQKDQSHQKIHICNFVLLPNN